MQQKILTYGDATLRKKAQPVENISHEIVMVIDDMFETMLNADGIGLAAVQIGSLERIIVMAVPREDGELMRLTLINPEIRERAGTVSGEEGCLSFPAIRGEVSRANLISVRAIGRDGNELAFDAEGLLSRVIQHETDHLDGVLFIDRMNPVKRALLKGKLNKLKHETTRIA